PPPPPPPSPNEGVRGGGAGVGSHGKPFSSFFHVAPPSVVLYKPPPGPLPLKPNTVRRRRYAPAVHVVGFDGSRARSLVSVASLMIRSLCHVFPPSVGL